jgi:hypothetical protein
MLLLGLLRPVWGRPYGRWMKLVRTLDVSRASLLRTTPLSHRTVGFTFPNLERQGADAQVKFFATWSLWAQTLRIELCLIQPKRFARTSSRLISLSISCRPPA